MISKSENSETPTDFRSISLVNELYKIISRVIAARIKPLMADLIHLCQAVFIPRRSITDNILLDNDLVRGFHLATGQAKMCLKLDLSKAFDSVCWTFLEVAWTHLNLPKMIIGWIMECILSPSFSIMINGSPCGFFNSGRGLRQGCPLSPYLLCIVMEFFTAALNDLAISGIIPNAN